MIIGEFVAVAIIAYLLGSIPFALIVGKLAAGIDISKYGSGNVGGTNVARTVGIKMGALVIVLDFAKAIGVVILAKVIVGDGVLLVAGFPLDWQAARVIAGLMVMVGHNWSVFIKFRGGKGVATYFGGCLVIWWEVALIGAFIAGVTVLVTRYMSMGSILGSLGVLCALMFFTLIYGFTPVYLVYGLVAAAMVVYQHRENIGRLQAGTELRLGGKRRN